MAEAQPVNSITYTVDRVHSKKNKEGVESPAYVILERDGARGQYWMPVSQIAVDPNSLIGQQFTLTGPGDVFATPEMRPKLSRPTPATPEQIQAKIDALQKQLDRATQ